MFKNRVEAGRLLAEKLSQYKKKENALVLAIPRGGVPVAYEVARRHDLPLDVIVIKKIGVPGNEELAAGAAGSDSHILNEEIIRSLGVPQDFIREQVKIKQLQVKQRYQLLRGNRPGYSLKNKTIILIDDGLATGATMTMAIQVIKKDSPQAVICAIPVAPSDTIMRLETTADQTVCLLQPPNFRAIGQFYTDFTQVEDGEAKQLLNKATQKEQS